MASTQCDEWTAPDGPAVDVIHQDCGQTTHLVPACATCGGVVERVDLTMVDGPGADDHPVIPRR